MMVHANPCSSPSRVRVHPQSQQPSCTHVDLRFAGYAAPGQSPGLALRVARAECLRDICSTDPDKAVELVGLVQVRGGGFLQCGSSWLQCKRTEGRR